MRSELWDWTWPTRSGSGGIRSASSGSVRAGPDSESMSSLGFRGVNDSAVLFDACQRSCSSTPIDELSSTEEFATSAVGAIVDIALRPRRGAWRRQGLAMLLLCRAVAVLSVFTAARYQGGPDPSCQDVRCTYSCGGRQTPLIHCLTFCPTPECQDPYTTSLTMLCSNPNHKQRNSQVLDGSLGLGLFAARHLVLGTCKLR